MRNFRLRRLVLVLLAASASPLQAAPLNAVLEQVLQQHPDVRTSRALLDASRESIVQARSNFFPVLGFTGQASEGQDEQSGVPLDRNVRRLDAQLRWNLYRGMTDKHSVRAAQYDSLAAEADLNEAHERVALEVTFAYLEVMRLRCLVELSKNFVEEQARLNDEINRRVSAGRIPVADASQAKSSLIQSERLLTQSKSQLFAAEQRFQMITGQTADALVTPAFELLQVGQSLDDLLEKVTLGSYRFKAARARLDARSEEVGMAAGALYPSIDLEFRKRLQSEIDPPTVTDTVENQAVQLNYQLPLGGATYSRKRQAEFRKSAARAETDGILLRLQSEISLSWALWKETVDLKQKYAERVQATNTVVAAYDLQFDAGRRNLNDLISVRSERFQAQSDLIENRFQELAANARMMSVFGDLKRNILEQRHIEPNNEGGNSICSSTVQSDKKVPHCPPEGCKDSPDKSIQPVKNTPPAKPSSETKYISMPMGGGCNPPFTKSCLAGLKATKNTPIAITGNLETLQLSKQSSLR